MIAIKCNIKDDKKHGMDAHEINFNIIGARDGISLQFDAKIIKIDNYLQR